MRVNSMRGDIVKFVKGLVSQARASRAAAPVRTAAMRRWLPRDRRNLAGLLALVILIALNAVFTIAPHLAFSDSKEPPSDKVLERGIAAGYERALPPSAPQRSPQERRRPAGAQSEGRQTTGTQRTGAQVPSATDFGAETIDTTTGGPSDPKPLPVAVAEDAGALPPESVRRDPAGAGGAPPAALPNNGTDTGSFTFLDVQDAEIATLVKTFSKLTGRNYIVDNTVKGKITIHLPTAVTMEEALRIFESVLLLKGFTTVPMGGNTWKVISAKDAKQTTIPMLGDLDDRASEALVTELIRLKNTQASDLQQVLNQFVSKDGILSAFATTNSLIVIDSAANIRRIRELVEQLDVPALDQDITIVPITHAEAKDLAEKINDILGSKDKEAQATETPTRIGTRLPRPMPIAVPGQPNAAAAAAAGGTVAGEKRTLPFRIIPDERTNSLIVVADQLTTDKVRALVEQLDSPVDKSTGRFFVYRLQHADATELAEILGNLIGGGGGSSGSSQDREPRGISGLNNNRSSGRRGDSSLDGFGGSQFGAASLRGASGLGRTRTRDTAGGSTSGSTGGSRGGADVVEGKVNLEGEVSIAADPSTNSLVINASKKDYEKLKQVIDELDVKRRQVLVEATILEVSLNKDEGLGVEFQTTAGTDDGGVLAQTNYAGLTNLLTNPAALSDLTIAAASSGSIVLPGGLTIPSQALLITALSRNSNVNVLSSPSILATDNEEAKIVVGENVPFVTSTSTNQTNLNNTFNQIDRQDVGITLTITPQISTGDFVILKIFVEISNVVPGTRNDPNGPTTTIRTTETVVEVKSGQMIATGGLISDSITDSTRGVPFFEDIPVLGNFFRRDDTNQRRTNLLVFITPKIVTDQFVAREETKSRSKSFRSEMERLGSEPDRLEVLESEKIDRVADSIQPDGPGPSLIRPPRGDTEIRMGGNPPAGQEDAAARARTLARLSQLSRAEQDSDAAVSDDRYSGVPPTGDTPAPAGRRTIAEESLEISVSPQLPGTSTRSGPKGKTNGRGAAPTPSGASDPGPASRSVSPPPSVEELLDDQLGDRPAPVRQQDAKVRSRTSTLANGAEAASVPTSPASAGASYVVVRQLSSARGASAEGPFKFADRSKTVGLLVPEGSLQAAFRPGGRYELVNGKDRYRFVCLGSYPSLAEASRAHPALSARSSWHTVPSSGEESKTMEWVGG